MFLSRIARCASNACGEVTETAEGFEITSTTEGNDGKTVLTPDEFAQFIADVKAGGFDELHRHARERMQPVIA